MCTNSVNTTQMKRAIEQAEMTVQLAQSAVHSLQHDAGHLGDEDVKGAMDRAAKLLAETHDELVAAAAACDASDSENESVVVELV